MPAALNWAASRSIRCRSLSTISAPHNNISPLSSHHRNQYPVLSALVPCQTPKNNPKIGRAVQQECRDRPPFPTRRSSDLTISAPHNNISPLSSHHRNQYPVLSALVPCQTPKNNPTPSIQ